ncbi:MAG: hypothetical protein ABID54_09890, partial [Pseudomonadota bacterium]
CGSTERRDKGVHSNNAILSMKAWCSENTSPETGGTPVMVTVVARKIFYLYYQSFHQNKRERKEFLSKIMIDNI